MLEDDGPEILVHCHALIFPSGSLDLPPLSNTLSVGRVMTVSGPATARGGGLFPMQSSQEYSFWQELRKRIAVISKQVISLITSFIKEDFKTPASKPCWREHR